MKWMGTIKREKGAFWVQNVCWLHLIQYCSLTESNVMWVNGVEPYQLRNLRNPPNLDWQFYWDLLFFLIDVSRTTQVLIWTNGQINPCHFPLSKNATSLSLSLILSLFFSPVCSVPWYVLPVLILLKYSDDLMSCYHWLQ